MPFSTVVSSGFPDDTPPLSPSRSSSALSDTQSSAASSSSGSVTDIRARMSKTKINGLVSQDTFEGLDSSNNAGHAKFPPRNSTITEDIMEEDSPDELRLASDDGKERGRGGYQDGNDSYSGEAVKTPRPGMPRQASYSKRHSSFDTPREVPFPQGYLVSSSQHQISDQHQQRSAARETPERSTELPDSSQDPNSLLDPMASHPIGEDLQFDDFSADSSLNNPPPTCDRSSSLPLPQSLHYSTLPPLSSTEVERYTNHSCFAPPSPPKSATPSKESLDGRSPRMSPSWSYKPTPRHESSPLSSSPALLAQEAADKVEAMPSQDSLALGGSRQQHDSLPPFARPNVTYSGPLATRPTSLPHFPINNFHTSIYSSSIPPPQPPVILTPPLPLSEAQNSRPLAPHEPFFPLCQPPPSDTYIAVETSSTEYRLSVRLPGFERDHITLSMRRRQVLHVVADNWGGEHGGHFERKIAFGYDADLGNVRAEFDGEFLTIVVPRKTPWAPS